MMVDQKRIVEIIPRIAENGTVDLIESDTGVVISSSPLTPQDASFLARSLLASAEALSSANPPNKGQLLSDAFFWIKSWTTHFNSDAQSVVFTMRMPSDIELTFCFPARGALEMGQAIVRAAEQHSRLPGSEGKRH